MEELVVHVFAHIARTARLADPFDVDIEVERPGIRFNEVGVEDVVKGLARALVEGLPVPLSHELWPGAADATGVAKSVATVSAPINPSRRRMTWYPI